MKDLLMLFRQQAAVEDFDAIRIEGVATVEVRIADEGEGEGRAYRGAMTTRGVDARGWDPAEKSMGEFIAAGFDRVWIALHGPGGEDGALQGLLQWLEVPYTGSGVMASAIAMDKVRSKHLFQAAGIPTPIS